MEAKIEIENEEILIKFKEVSFPIAKYVYPAISTPEEKGSYSVVFLDLKGYYTCGDNLEDGILQEALIQKVQAN